MKNLTLIAGFLFLGICLAANAVETSPSLETADETYTNTISDHFDYYVNVLSLGFPIGQAKSKKQGGATVYVNDLDKVIETLKDRNVKVLTAYQELQKEIRQTAGAPQAAGPGADQSPPSPPSPRPVSLLSKEMFRDLISCAKRTLPRLKALSQMERTQDTVDAELLSNEIRRESGDGHTVGYGGLPCGKFLGQMGNPGLNELESIKTLSALTARDGDEQKELLVAYILSRKTAKIEASYHADFWAYLWNELSFASVFSKRPLLGVSDIVARYLQVTESFRKTSGSITATISLDEVKRGILKEWDDESQLVEGSLR